MFDPLLIGTCAVRPSDCARNLGFMFNRSLSIADHIIHLKQTTFYHLTRINSLRDFLSLKQREVLVHAFITSRLDFCNSLFFLSSKEYLKAIQSILSSTAKALTGTGRRSSSVLILQQLHWLPIEHRILYKLAIFGFNAVHKKLPEYFNDIYVLVPNRTTRSCKAPLLTSRLYQSRVNLLNICERSCFYSICDVFNSLPADIRATENVMSFKSKLKTHLYPS